MSLHVSLRMTLASALASLALWFLLAFIVGSANSGVHLLLAIATTLLVRWWALRM